jgi:HEAT repeat protein
MAKVDYTIHNLRNGDEAQRRAAAEWLREHPDPKAYDTLLAALDDPNSDVIWWAAAALASLGMPAALEPLRLAFVRYYEKDWMEPARMHSGIGLPDFSWSISQLMRSASTEILIRTIRRKDVHDGMRIDAANILGERRASEASAALTEMVNDPGHAAACAAAKALLTIGDPDAVRQVQLAYESARAYLASGSGHTDSDGKRCSGLFHSLLRFETEEQVTQRLNDGDYFERATAAFHLGERGAKGGKEVLEAAANDAEKSVAQQAKYALWKMGFLKSLPRDTQ